MILLVGLALAVWLNGGQLFNPGPVSAKAQPGVTYKNYASHADFENQCGLCHQPLNAEQDGLCKACHANIQDQIDKSNGVHGRIKDVSRCAACHAEHKGREFDPSQAALDNFNHNQTDFTLTYKHAVTPCKDCHKNGDYQNVSVNCVTCHTEPPVHAGMFNPDCAECHTAEGWKPAKLNGTKFSHEINSFSLSRHAVGYDNQPIPCNACHDHQTKPVPAQKCIACHSNRPAKKATVEKIANASDFLTSHTQTFGKNCLDCHDGLDKMGNFDHNKVFSLDGKHAGLECTSCHVNQKFAGTNSQCVSCHKEPAIHAGFFGLKCNYCHTSEAWRPALLHAHNFPLDHGGKGEVECKVCHTGSYAVNTCYGCHDHQAEKIQASHAKVSMPKDVTLEQCTACHLNGKVNK